VPAVHVGKPPQPSRCPPGAAGRPVDGRRALGALGEELAAAHFRRLGFSVLARNVRTRRGEIDLIAFDGATLVFAEVKTRRARRPRDRPIPPEEEPLSTLRRAQRARLRGLALAWLSEQARVRPSARTIRFDAVGVIVDRRERLVRLDHLEAAW
jgi:putative endonuclease